MTESVIERKYRSFLLVVAGLIFVVTSLELLLAEHFQSIVQVSPLLLCGAGLGSVIMVYRAPKRNLLLGLRGVMVAIIVGSWIGIYEHVEHNFGFELEIRPTASWHEVAWRALFGASPLLAPGILALGALLALAATYRHPALATTVATGKYASPRAQ